TAQQLLLVKIREIIAEYPDNDNYGVKRIRLALAQKGIKRSHSTVHRAMKAGKLLKKKKWRPQGLTKADATAQKAANLIAGDFSASSPNEKWLTDITEVACKDGKLYIAPIMDCYDGIILGLAMEDNMRKELCIEALEQACRYSRIAGVLVHSDRGSQYSSELFRETLTKHKAVQSMSGAGRCYDNARMESFFATLKKEKLYRIKTEQLTMEEVKTITFRYIMVYYNRQRICTTNIEGWPPETYRKMYKPLNFQESATRSNNFVC
ncbi:MAG: IS3 family transposase, partial [Anaerovoracaceae bacterium]